MLGTFATCTWDNGLNARIAAHNTRVSSADGAVWCGDDELETLVRFAMLWFDEPGQGGRENE